MNFYKKTRTITQHLFRCCVSLKTNTIHLWLCVLLGTCTFGVMAQTTPIVNPQGYNNISLAGVTAYDPQKLWLFAVEHAHKQSSEFNIENIAEAIQLIYREDGYFLVGVHVVHSGNSAQLTVHEGRLSKIEISGATPELAQTIHKYVMTAVGDQPLTLERFERGMMLARDLSGVALTSEFVSSQGVGVLAPIQY